MIEYPCGCKHDIYLNYETTGHGQTMIKWTDIRYGSDSDIKICQQHRNEIIDKAVFNHEFEQDRDYSYHEKMIDALRSLKK